MDTAARKSASQFLQKCIRAYEALVARVLKLEVSGDDEKTLRWMRLAASVAWIAHPGRFVDERLEAVGLRIGHRLQPQDSGRHVQTGEPTGNAGERRHVLHVATTTYEIGGHTRLIENWVKKDDSSTHSLILLDQRDNRIRADLFQAITATGGKVLVVPTGCSLLDKARQLRHNAQTGYDLVVLHAHPNDVVPLVALSTTSCPPVAIMNHADHVFWLGIAVADAVVDFREYGARISAERRGVRRSFMFPLPVNPRPATLSRVEARALLGIPDDRVVLLSMGGAMKYRPSETHNFFTTLNRVLNDNVLAGLYVIGVTPHEVASFGMTVHERAEYLGIVADPSTYEAAADIYLEGFPLNSYTALLETAIRGVCPVLMYAPTPQLDLSSDPALSGLVTSAKDECAYVAGVSALINDPIQRTMIARAVARRISSVNGGDTGETYLRPIYDQLAGVNHQPAFASVRRHVEDGDDLDLAGFNRSKGLRALLAHGADEASNHLTIFDLFRVLAISIHIRDTRPQFSHVRMWLGIFRRKAFPPARSPAQLK